MLANIKFKKFDRVLSFIDSRIKYNVGSGINYLYGNNYYQTIGQSFSSLHEYVRLFWYSGDEEKATTHIRKAYLLILTLKILFFALVYTYIRISPFSSYLYIIIPGAIFLFLYYKLNDIYYSFLKGDEKYLFSKRVRISNKLKLKNDLPYYDPDFEIVMETLLKGDEGIVLGICKTLRKDGSQLSLFQLIAISRDLST